jgi:glycosyltransferase involved in cell wall biosynthesis
MLVSVLLIGPYPPDGGVGCERILKFQKYLPEFGYQPYILTFGSDQALANDELKGVFRAFEPRQLYRPLVLSWRKSSYQKQSVYRGGLLDDTPVAGLRQWILDRWIIPDSRIGGLLPAIVLGHKVIRTKNVKVIFSSSLPETSHLVALALKLLTGVRWVADFRDGWIFESLKPALRRPTLRLAIEKFLERSVISRADAVVSVTQPTTDYFAATYPSGKKYHTISNGYDPVDWQDLPLVEKDKSKFTLVYTGTLSLSSFSRTAFHLFHALKNLPLSISAQFELVLVGQLTLEEQWQLEYLQLASLVRVVGPVKRSLSLAYQRSADALLLIIGFDRSVATSKLYEYLYGRLPILALSGVDTAGADTIRKTNSGVVINPLDTEGITECLINWHSQWRTGKLICESHDIEQYERRQLTSQLVRVMDNLHD